MKRDKNSIYFLPNDDWAYFATFVLPNHRQESPKITHMELGQKAVRGWFNRLKGPLRDLSNRTYPRGRLPIRACCVPEYRDKHGNPKPLHFHALISQSILFERNFGGINGDVFEQDIWHRCLNEFKNNMLNDEIVSVHIEKIYCIDGLKKYIIKNVDIDFNIKNIMDIK